MSGQLGQVDVLGYTLHGVLTVSIRQLLAHHVRHHRAQLLGQVFYKGFDNVLHVFLAF
jgi:hypothetical protein